MFRGGGVCRTTWPTKELSEDEEHTYFFIIDASISESMIEKNPALKYLPFFPVKINEKSTKKSGFMKAQCEKNKLRDVDTFKLATVLDMTEKYMVHIKYLRLAMEAGYELDNVHRYFKFARTMYSSSISKETIISKQMQQNQVINFSVILPSSYPTSYTVKQFRTS